MLYFLSGLALGFGAGIAPGPLLALVLAETLQGGFRRGLMIALAPLITDAPIILAAIFVLSALPGWALPAIELAGGLFVAYLGIDSIRAVNHGQEMDASSAPASRQSLRRGVMTNALNPHPYLFWGTVGAPSLLEAGRISPALAGLFLLGFYLPLVGTKVGLAALVAQHHHLLRGRGYRWALLISAGLLLLFGGYVVETAIQGLVMLTGR